MEKIIDLPYDSPEWHEFRKTHIGGSDASVIMCCNPWKSLPQLYDEKRGLIPPQDISKKKAVKHGKSAEEHITALFALDHQDEFEVELIKDKVFVNDFMMASVDARLFEKSTRREGFLEVKTGELRRGIDFEKWNEKIPDYYYPQIIHYFNTRKKFEFGIVIARLKEWFYNPEIEDFEWRITERPYRFERFECLSDMSILMQAEIKFNENLTNKKRPPLRLPNI